MLYMFLIFYAFLDHEIEIHLYFSSQKKHESLKAFNRNVRSFKPRL